jgi:hypothetical protein
MKMASKGNKSLYISGINWHICDFLTGLMWTYCKFWFLSRVDFVPVSGKRRLDYQPAFGEAQGGPSWGPKKTYDFRFVSQPLNLDALVQTYTMFPITYFNEANKNNNSSSSNNNRSSNNRSSNNRSSNKVSANLLNVSYHIPQWGDHTILVH